ncbi:MAG: hypothetical protein L6R37_003863, partial [Teloschistes peruensis]
MPPKEIIILKTTEPNVKLLCASGWINQRPSIDFFAKNNRHQKMKKEGYPAANKSIPSSFTDK